MWQTQLQQHDPLRLKLVTLNYSIAWDSIYPKEPEQMKKTLEQTKTCRYFTHGNPEIANHVIYALHGYGQLPEYFIRKFHALPEHFFIVCPEGMHRFYLNGTSGRVGASWMTKEARQDDIQDTMNWLKRVKEDVETNYYFTTKTLLGFSQGGATAARSFFEGGFDVDNLIIWASVFPPDLPLHAEMQRYQNSVNNTNKYFFIGDNDEYYTPEQQIEISQFYEQNNFKSTIYTGKHDLNSDILNNLLTPKTTDGLL